MEFLSEHNYFISYQYELTSNSSTIVIVTDYLQ